MEPFLSFLYCVLCSHLPAWQKMENQAIMPTFILLVNGLLLFSTLLQQEFLCPFPSYIFLLLFLTLPPQISYICFSPHILGFSILWLLVLYFLLPMTVAIVLDSLAARVLMSVSLHVFLNSWHHGFLVFSSCHCS